MFLCLIIFLYNNFILLINIINLFNKIQLKTIKKFNYGYIKIIFIFNDIKINFFI